MANTDADDIPHFPAHIFQEHNSHVAHWILIYKWQEQTEPSQFYKWCFWPCVTWTWNQCKGHADSSIQVGGGAFSDALYVTTGTVSKGEYKKQFYVVNISISPVFDLKNKQTSN